MEGEPTEMDNLIGEGKRRQWCCRTHPVACIVTACVILALGVAVATVGAVFHSRVDQAVQDAIAQVPQRVYTWRVCV